MNHTRCKNDYEAECNSAIPVSLSALGVLCVGDQGLAASLLEALNDLLCLLERHGHEGEILQNLDVVDLARLDRDAPHHELDEFRRRHLVATTQRHEQR